MGWFTDKLTGKARQRERERQRKVAADREFLASMEALQADPDTMASVSYERRQYVYYAVQAFRWWLSGPGQSGREPTGPRAIPPRDRIIREWSMRHGAPRDPAYRERIEAAISAQTAHMDRAC